MNEQDIQKIRQDYTKHSLDESEVDRNPFKQFIIWFQEAIEAQVMEPNAFTLGTVDSSNKPHTRILLLKGLEGELFKFYTNYASDKGAEIESNNNVSMCFFWGELERQVRVDGVASKLSFEESDAYFRSRPHLSQVGAHGALLMVDNTFATPFHLRPISLGADVVAHSTTKYLGGHGAVIGGALVLKKETTIEVHLHKFRKNLGGVAGPMDAWLLTNGIKTLPLRMRKHGLNTKFTSLTTNAFERYQIKVQGQKGTLVINFDGAKVYLEDLEEVRETGLVDGVSGATSEA